MWIQRLSVISGLIVLVAGATLLCFPPRPAADPDTLILPWARASGSMPLPGDPGAAPTENRMARALQSLWSRSLLHRTSDGTLSGEIADAWEFEQITHVRIDPGAKLPDGLAYSPASARGYLNRLRGRPNDFLAALTDLQEDKAAAAAGIPGPTLRFHLSRWEPEAALRLREILGNELLPSRYPDVPTPISRSDFLIRFRIPPTRLSSGTIADWTKLAAVAFGEFEFLHAPREVLRDDRTWIEFSSKDGSDAWKQDATRLLPALAADDGDALLTTGGFRIIASPERRIGLEKRPGAPSPEGLVRILFRPAGIPLDGAVTGVRTVRELSPIEWPEPGLNAHENRGPGVVVRPGTAVAVVVFDARRSPLDLPDLRRGLAGLVRRRTIIEYVWKGRAEPVDGPLPATLLPAGVPGMDGLDAAIDGTAALARAGFQRENRLSGAPLAREEIPLEIDLLVRPDEVDLIPVAEAVARDWLSAGVRVRIRIPSWNATESCEEAARPQAWLRRLDPYTTPLAEYGDTSLLKTTGSPDRPPVEKLSSPESSAPRLRLISRAWREEVAGIPLGVPTREFRIEPAPPGAAGWEETLAPLLDALPPRHAGQTIPPLLRSGGE